MPKWKVSGPGGERVVEAQTEDEARQKAMIERWGEKPDKVVPGAPFYKGRGLSVVRVKE